MLKKLKSVPLIMMVSAFLTLDFTLLFLNLNLTQKLEKDAATINLTGRQRMLSQRIAKSCLLTCSKTSLLNSTEREDLIRSVNLFHQTLNALQEGGSTQTPQGNNIKLKPIRDEESQAIISETFVLWTDVYAALKRLEKQNFQNPSERDTRIINAYATETNEKILKLMNDLTVRSEQLSVKNAGILRQAQVVIFILVLVNFLLIVLRFRKADSDQSAFMHQLESLIHTLPQGILLVDDQHQVVYANKIAEEIFSLTVEELKLHNVDQLLPMPVVAGSITLSDKHLEIDVSNVVTIPRELKMISLLDVTESIVLKKKSAYDNLTQLLNRNGLIEAYNQIKDVSPQVCCLFLDLNKFKGVNDRYGHSTGDQVLMVIAKRLKSCLKSNDIVARFGGDEFVIILNEAINNEDIDQLCRRLKQAIDEPIDIEHLIVQLGVSIGIRIGYPQEESMEVIIDDADRAMYVDKNQSRLL